MKKIARKTLAVSLATAMAFSLAACGDKGNKDTTDTNQSTQSAVVDENATYTYNIATADFPTNWNPHTYQTAIDAEFMLDYLRTAFYVFDYNENKDGYKLVPYMITNDPEDVSAEYVGQYGIEEGATSRAWKFTLRDDLKWDDGTPIVAADFIRSAELLLNPVAVNHRADSLYQGNMIIANAKNFAYAGQHAYVNNMISADYADEEYVAIESLTTDENGVYTVDGKDIAFKLDNSGNWGSDGLTDYHGVESYLPVFTKDGVDLYTTVLEPALTDAGYVPATKETVDALMHIVAGLHGYDSVEAYAAEAGEYAYKEWEEFCFYGETYPEMSFDEVGMKAPSDTELVLILEKPLEGFDLHYALTDSWLVKEDLYKQCESVKDGVYTNSYGTSVETTASYGPYKLTTFQADKEITLTRNENFFGLVDGQYQTTAINIACVEEPSTRLEMLLSGKLDSYGLSADDMETYASSDYTYYTTEDSTYFMAFNPDMEGLKAGQEALGAGYNKTILTVKEFRQAMAYALDRSAFALAAAPTNNAAFGLYSSLIVSDPETGETYRSTDEAKWVLANFWGLGDEVGEGKMYETVDDAVASITGYNLEMAKQLFDKAYDIAIADGLMKEGDTIQIMIGTPNSTSNFYSKGNEFLVNCFTDAVVGTKLEGKLTFTLDDTLGNGFSDALRSNKVDMLFGVGWTGSALDPYNLMEAYTSSGYQYDPCWDTTTEKLTINLNGVDYTATVWDWTQAISGIEVNITAADGTVSAYSCGSADNKDEERFQILVALENAVLENYNMIPMVDDSYAQLKGMQIQYYTEDYIFGVGRGGVRYMTYNYTDADWDAYVSSQSGTLNYK